MEQSKFRFNLIKVLLYMYTIIIILIFNLIYFLN
jgi:hypothetical protein